jgi:hypothetical protein
MPTTDPVAAADRDAEEAERLSRITRQIEKFTVLFDAIAAALPRRRESALKFNARRHFSSGEVAVCVECERRGEGSWPSSFLMTSRGFVCLWCAFPGQYDEDGKWLGHKP